MEKLFSVNLTSSQTLLISWWSASKRAAAGDFVPYDAKPAFILGLFNVKSAHHCQSIMRGDYSPLLSTVDSTRPS